MTIFIGYMLFFIHLIYIVISHSPTIYIYIYIYIYMSNDNFAYCIYDIKDNKYKRHDGLKLLFLNKINNQGMPFFTK